MPKVDGDGFEQSSNLLRPLQFRNYKWPYNPSSYSIKFSKRIIEHKYIGINNSEIEDLGTEARVISGSGSFFGPLAYVEFGKLASTFYEKGPAYLSHPVWQDCFVTFSKLSLTQEPTPNFVAYEFEFIEHIDINVFEEVKISNTNIITPASPIKNSNTSVKYVVRQGDTLSGIAAKFGVAWRDIANDNKKLITNPNNLQVGWTLTINQSTKKPIISKKQSSNGTGDPAYDRFMRDFGNSLPNNNNSSKNDKTPKSGSFDQAYSRLKSKGE